MKFSVLSSFLLATTSLAIAQPLASALRQSPAPEESTHSLVFPFRKATPAQYSTLLSFLDHELGAGNYRAEYRKEGQHELLFVVCSLTEQQTEVVKAHNMVDDVKLDSRFDFEGLALTELKRENHAY